jgi:predicted dehydrogenase
MAGLRVATVGAGYFSQFHHDAWSRLDEVELVAVCDVDARKARDFAERYGAAAHFTDARAMLDAVRPDLVDIVTPPPTHLPLIRLAAERGVDAVCQKAFCRTLDEAEEAVATAEAAGIRLVVHENFRFQPWYGEMREWLAAGRLGEVYQATFRLRPGDGQGPDAYLDRQPYFQTMERLLVHETAIHFVDVFRFLLGEVEAVTARLRRLNPVIRGEDAGIVLLEHESGALSLFDGNRLVDHAAEQRRLTLGEMLIEGSGGVLRLDGDGRLWHRAFGDNAETAVAFRRTARGFGGDSVLRLQRHVVDHLLRGTPLVNTARDYLANLRVEALIYRSADSGRRETVAG